jgi:phage major head subunit gpT-like protein
MARPSPQTIDVPPLSLRAEVSSFNEEQRTVDLIFSTGAPVERFDWMSGKRYLEVLSMEPKAIRLERMNSGAPLLDSHSAWSVTDQLGAVVPGTARIEKGHALATVKFSARAAVAGVLQDVKDQIIRSVSVGYRVRAFVEDTSKDGVIPTRTATDWEPYEISLVSMPADNGAKIRRADVETNSCILISRDLPKETVMAETPGENVRQDKSEFVVEQDPLKPESTTQRLALADDKKKEPNDRDRGVIAERERVQGINNACRAARLPNAFGDDLIQSGMSLVDAQTRVFKELQSREADGPRPGGVALASVSDNMVHVRAGIENAILHRISPTLFKLEDVGRDYRGMTLIGIADSYLKAQGVRTTRLSKSEIAGMALGLNQRGGYHTTSDFADLLEGIVSQTLRKAYDEAPQTYTVISRQMTAPDFKNITMLQFGEAPALVEVKEHGEYTRGTIGLGKEAFALKTYGRIFAITRAALVNDDVDAFSQVPLKFGRSARTLESDLVWAQITGNAQMGDNENLFSAAHANLETDGDRISIDSLSRARRAIRLQTSTDGTTMMNLTPKYLLVPPSLETVAQQFVGQITPSSAANANPFSGLLTVIAEPRLEDDSALAWYLAVSPDQTDIVVYAYLEGQTGPTIEQRVGFDVDGLEIKCRHDFAAKVVDWRGLHKDPGEEDS